jgi:hypothetical protein
LQASDIHTCKVVTSAANPGDNFEAQPPPPWKTEYHAVLLTQEHYLSDNRMTHCKPYLLDMKHRNSAGTSTLFN